MRKHLFRPYGRRPVPVSVAKQPLLQAASSILDNSSSGYVLAPALREPCAMQVLDHRTINEKHRATKFS